MPSECAAAGYSEKLTKEFSFHAFPFKNEARKRKWQVPSAAMNRWDLATKKWEPKHHDVLCSKYFEKEKKKKVLHRSHTAEHSVWAEINVYMGVHRVTDLEKKSNSNLDQSKDETPSPLRPLGLCLFPSCQANHN